MVTTRNKRQYDGVDWDNGGFEANIDNGKHLEHKIEEGRKRKRCVGGELVKLSYDKHQHYYYFGWHVVGNNNNNSQGHLPFKESYCSNRWDLWQLGFVIALAQSNAQLAYTYFVPYQPGKGLLSKVEFQQELAQDLVYNVELMSAVEVDNGGIAL